MAEPGYPAERTKAFADAVVAIAMTLLILPLMDSVGERAQEDAKAGAWLAAEWGSIYVFVLSFVLIAMFWFIHHRLFTGVERVSGPLQWMIIGWLLTIVWLPVATAMTGRFDDDALQKSLYIGSMILPCVASFAIRAYLRRRPALHSIPDGQLLGGLSIDITMSVLFAVALVVSVAVPAIGYNALFLLLLVSPVSHVIDRMLGVRRPARRSARDAEEHAQ